MNNKKKIILSVLIVLLLLVVGVTYAFFTYENGTKSEIVTGQIYMNYEETNNISLTGVFPETKEQALARQDENGLFEFTITGRNTSKNPVYYEIDLLEGGLIAGATESSTKILPEHVRIYLERDGEVLIDGKKYNDWDNRRVFVETIPANQTSNIEHEYTLIMWIDENVTISDTDQNADYTTTEWNTAYTSLQVRVVGDFNPKELPGTMAKLGSGWGKFWADDIENIDTNIKEVKFIRLDNNEIDTRYNASTIKSDVSTSQEYPVKAWLEVDETDATKYIMYVASEEEIYFPSDSGAMFRSFSSLNNILFDNVNTSQSTTMWAMFNGCKSLTSLDLSVFDTSQVTEMTGMFFECMILESLNLSKWDTSNVTGMAQMFFECRMLNQIINVENFNVDKVTNMYGMFYRCKSLTSLNLSSWKTGQVTSFGQMFLECEGLQNLNVSGWNTGNVIDMSSMFLKCSSLTRLDLGNWNTEKVENVKQMFANCVILNQLDISSFTFNSVTSMSQMFVGTGSNLQSGTYTTVYVKADYVLNGTTYSPQTWILNLGSSDRPSGWSNSNVIVKQ